MREVGQFQDDQLVRPGGPANPIPASTLQADAQNLIRLILVRLMHVQISATTHAGEGRECP